MHTVFFFFSEFAASEPVVGLPEGTLLQYFSQLRQLLDLFMSWDWPTYFHDYGHDSSKYNLVTPNMAVLLLEKYVFICTCIIFLHDVTWFYITLYDDTLIDYFL